MKGLLSGLFTYASVPGASFKYNLWPFYLLSGAISTVLGVVLVYGSLSYGDDFGVWASSFISWEWAASWINKIGAFAGRTLAVVLSLILYKYLVLIIVSPIMSPLSARIENRIKGRHSKSGFSIVSFSKEMLRGFRVALRNVSRELFYSLLLVIISFIPGMAIITTPLLFLVQAYYAGFANMDYYMERHYSVRDSVTFVRQNRGLAIGNGSIFLLVLLIPFFGFLIAPGLSATAATLAIVNRDL